MARLYPRLRVTKATTDWCGWHVSAVTGPDSGPVVMCHHASWRAAVTCAYATTIMFALLGPPRSR
ncbi:hypothetical protein HWD35_20715 [Tsukamurella tyrosinosolvens]|uniref:hypothetical protein n=1 Tax=Tsukamurella tyrosinosolvens TaxID=57704 RepID=UPI001CE21629|nr:hypothetical protein [Tsukamurella tyrosinosolvens]MCA4997148.1 hypothetical protein [Tsukamurella tyrosinosolvens]